MGTQRIPSVGKMGRDSIIAKYCPEHLQANIRQREDLDPNTLIRVYLGRERCKTENSTPDSFSMHNFPLHLDQLRELGLNEDFYLCEMAQTLAILHWHAGIDAAGVEFVLGGSTNAEEANKVELWILDFDQCRHLPDSSRDNIITALIRSFERNDPYYPRPGVGGQEIWDKFKAVYIASSDLILEKFAFGQANPNKTAGLPALFMERLETRLRGEQN